MAAAASVRPDARRRGIKALLARYPLVFYFIIAYAFSWLAGMPLMLSEDGAGLPSKPQSGGQTGSRLNSESVRPPLATASRLWAG
jgi:hypothetical protein